MEECYWEVTVLSDGLMQIGAAVFNGGRLPHPFHPKGVNGVGDLGCSVGFDLSRKVQFLPLPFALL